MMGYHVEKDRFEELPDSIIVREDGYMSAYRQDGEPIVDYVYERRVESLNFELAKFAVEAYAEFSALIDALAKHSNETVKVNSEVVMRAKAREVELHMRLRDEFGIRDA